MRMTQSSIFQVRDEGTQIAGRAAAFCSAISELSANLGGTSRKKCGADHWLLEDRQTISGIAVSSFDDSGQFGMLTF
jgi:hypothetical protein